MVAGMWIVIIFKHDFVEYGTTCNVNALIIYLCYTSKLLFNYVHLYWSMSLLINKSDTTVNIEYSLLVFYCQYYLPHAKFTTMVCNLFHIQRHALPLNIDCTASTNIEDHIFQYSQ